MYVCSNCAVSFPDGQGLIVLMDNILVACVCPTCTNEVGVAKLVLRHNGIRLAYDQYTPVEMRSPSFGKAHE